MPRIVSALFHGAQRRPLEPVSAVPPLLRAGAWGASFLSSASTLAASVVEDERLVTAGLSLLLLAVTLGIVAAIARPPDLTLTYRRYGRP